MRLSLLAFATLFAASAVHGATMPTQQQIQAAVDAGVAKTGGTIPMAFKITSLKGCLPSQEVDGEVACLVGMSAGMRDGFTVLPLRQNGGNWIGVERKKAKFPGPAPEVAQTLIRDWANKLAASDPQAAKDPQVQEAQTVMQVKTIEQCEVKRQSGYVACNAVLTVPGKPDISTDLQFVYEDAAWQYVPR
ncbi:hypothetical protein [Janthinobacterium aquaticum]|uniref:hypothetical protein n=1 Tax=Janthinobacterium sp. FT58W TaxID=2654254 RepID=UPI0012642EB6|nr:hypothetical protein [Janthinobacterium sp. FT58W]KAB8042745.1 hypothetical protein GCM43_11820 [Janthinobacterium sp. FT58W]